MTAFTVSYSWIKLRVQLLQTSQEVDARYREGRRRRNGEHVHAYFQASKTERARHSGTIVLALDGRLAELIPHEVAHAVIHCLRGVSGNDDEVAATAIGMLSASIFERVRTLHKPSKQ
ncbi:hypothetical protein ACO0LO_01925 [Undibacterium sp. TJN25]|uniref:hypothetical protein n=1 Tax=Undibacterium sp. TJN25 TaxID=3413056 RepID=UPI003BF15DF6